MLNFVQIVRAVAVVFALLVGSNAISGCALAQQTTAVGTAPLSVLVFASDESSFLVNSTLILGKTDACLVDAQLTVSNAHRLVAAVLETHHRLTTIFVTHAHPDHFSGLEVLRQAFPAARIVAVPVVVEDIKNNGPRMLAFWASRLGDNATKTLVVPEALEEPNIALEGETIDVIGPLQGDTPHNSVLWIPSIKALIAGDVVFGATHLWTAGSSAETRKAWLASLDRLESMEPAVVIPGHSKPGAPLDASAIRHARAWLEHFEAAAGNAEAPGDIVDAMRRAFPEDGFAFALEYGAKAATEARKE
jgi:glyoxylase-like metal-dependent hydrolase (beta-lactamase superfamily II)